LSQRWWIGLYVLLAGASVAFAMRPGLLSAVMRWFTRLRIVPSINTGHRVATSTHITLLVAALIGAAAPTTVVPDLNARSASRHIAILAENLTPQTKLNPAAEFHLHVVAWPRAHIA
jgi:hypothetical protein